MELDELKTKWNELDERLAGTEATIKRLETRIASGQFSTAKQRVVRTARLGILIAVCLPFCFLNIFRYEDTGPGIAVKVLMVLFIAVVLTFQVVQLWLLGKIDPRQGAVRETCVAVLRFRRWFFAGIVAATTLAVPLLAALGIYMWRLPEPYMFYGFVSGLAVGLVFGVRVFLRRLDEINTLSGALRE